MGVFASGIRNPVGLAIHPDTGELWTSVNERDNLGDNLVPDYVTHVERGGFYGCCHGSTSAAMRIRPMLENTPN